MIVITSFEKFGKYRRNPTMDVAKSLEKEYKTVNIPVTFREAREISREILEKYNPELIISMGFAPSRAQISVEAVALNIMHSTVPDNDNFAPEPGKIFSDGPESYIYQNAHAVVELLKSKNIPAYISYSAGTYVCNALYYSFNYWIDKLNMESESIFIHLPPDETYAIEHPRSPYVRKEDMTEAIRYIAENFFREKKNGE